MPGRGQDERRRARGALEDEVLAVLWAADGPLSAAQVREGLDGDLAYTTVLTIMSRLYDKGLLKREREGRGHVYGPVRDRAAHAAAGMRTLLEGGADHEAVLARFVSELSDDDELLLHRLLNGRSATDPGAGEA
jgi:predicted transcriptional regulator